jgi:arsenite-transporting ATPase
MNPDKLLDELEAEFEGEFLDELGPLEPTIQSLLDKKSLKWIFVGGKGGVGKTTTSSCIATLLSKVRESVLIISTDPAHNLSDAFDQKFTKEPGLVRGFDNLYAMEIDPAQELEEKDILGSGNDEFQAFKELATSIPGIDEAMGFAEVMRLVQSMQFEVIIFDTAPTGHTLRLLSFPSVLDKGIGKIMQLKNKFAGVFQQVSGMFGGGEGINTDEMTSKLEKTKLIIEEVNRQFQNPAMTTFVCVCIPEFLSLYETERLVQELTKFKIDVDNIIVNQVLFPKKGSSCSFCECRVKMQQKYINQIGDLYEDFHVLKLPLLEQEVRGKADLENFAKLMLTSYEEEWKKSF